MEEFRINYQKLAPLLIAAAVVIYALSLPEEFKESGGALSILPALSGLLGVFLGNLITTRSQEALHGKTLENQLRLAAVDRRLEVHQEAFSIWIKIYHNLHNPEKLGDLVTQGFKWWESNCLYLSEQLARHFRRALNEAANYEFYKSLDRSKENIRLLRVVNEDIQSVGVEIQSAVGLPTIGNLGIDDKAPGIARKQ